MPDADLGLPSEAGSVQRGTALPPNEVEMTGAVMPQTDARLSALSERLGALDRLTDAKFVRMETLVASQAEKVKLALDAAEKAILKAEIASEKRFESVNEFRETLSDQQRSLMSKEAGDKIVENMLRDREEAQRQILEVRAFVNTLTEAKLDAADKVAEERFNSIHNQFTERDTRSERESRDNTKAVDAAFAAQKESAAKQDESNAKAIDKSERATAETIVKLGDLTKSNQDALTDKIDDVKQRLGRLEAGGLATLQERSVHRDDRLDHRQTQTQISGMVFGTLGVLVGLAGLITAIIVNSGR